MCTVYMYYMIVFFELLHCHMQSRHGNFVYEMRRRSITFYTAKSYIALPSGIYLITPIDDIIESYQLLCMISCRDYR